jgi:hypothetical protein
MTDNMRMYLGEYAGLRLIYHEDAGAPPSIHLSLWIILLTGKWTLLLLPESISLADIARFNAFL